MKKLLSILLAITAFSPVFAHEGHGHTHGYTITHYFVEPEHAIALVAGAAIITLLVSRYRKAASKL